MGDTSRLLAAKTPGGLLSAMQGLLTANELLIVQAIETGTYFVFNEIPSGLINGVNKTFTLASAPKPTDKCEVFINGIKQKLTTEYSLSGAIITMINAPAPTDTIFVNYLLSPV